MLLSQDFMHAWASQILHNLFYSETVLNLE